MGVFHRGVAWRVACRIAWLCLLAGSPAQARQEVVFAAYNLENYTLNGSAHTHPKPVAARDAVAEVVAAVKPDILGVCEIGSMDSLADLRERLRLRGVELPHAEFVQGPDADRHLALLSRFPIVQRHSKTQLRFELRGHPELVRRGFLDATVQINGRYSLRLVGVHLKSKLPTPRGEEVIRRREAELLRRHLDGLLSNDPGLNLLVYGDFNDTREQPALREIQGTWGSPLCLVELPAEDPNGERWTHYRHYTDVYARIDYLMVSRALRREVVGPARICSAPQWKKASDHRLLYTTIAPENR
jgi:endonuclease/exonuclease/phosphatase family metal-dependent hydrolase